MIKKWQHKPGIAGNIHRIMQYEEFGDEAIEIAVKHADDVAELTYKAGNSKTLRKNMVKAGMKGLGKGADGKALDAAHHIVAGGSKHAKETRKLLKKFGIGINDAVNGVFLDKKFHAKLHTKQYYKKVHNLLSKAKTKEQAIKILNNIGEKLQKGIF